MTNSRALTIFWGGVVVVLLLFRVPGSHAQPPVVTSSDRAAQQQELLRLNEQVLRNPADAELTFRYAAVANSLGDYEAAITALERVLFFNPNLPRIRVELGIAYFRLGAYETARTYFEQARAQGLTPELARIVDQYIAEAEGVQKRDRFAGQITTGVQYQSNANLSAGAAAIRPFGFETALGERFRRKSDENLFFNGSVVYARDLGDQDRTSVEATLIGYFAKYFRVQSFDLVYLEATLGPRSALASWRLEGFTGRPYVILDYVRLGDDPLFYAYGFGLDATQALSPGLSLRGLYELRDKRFADPTDRPTASALSGVENAASVQLSWDFAPRQNLTGTVLFVDVHARESFQSNRQYGAGLAYQITYSPFSGEPWLTSASVARVVYDYAAPDPAFDPGNARFDKRWRLGLTQTVPLARSWSVVLQLQRDIVSSSIAAFEYTNTSITAAAQLRF